MGKTMYGNGHFGTFNSTSEEISAGCGLAWRMRPEEWEQWSGRIDTSVYDKVSCVWQ